MKINPQKILSKMFFINNLCLIGLAFCIVCFITAIVVECLNGTPVYQDLKNEVTIGPIVIKDKPVIYKVGATFLGKNSSSYISGEVLDENKDTLYEFGKDLWEENGYDAEGYWSEADKRMSIPLVFREKGEYYIQFNPDDSNTQDVYIYFQKINNSHVIYLQMASIIFLLILIVLVCVNAKWINGELKRSNSEQKR